VFGAYSISSAGLSYVPPVPHPPVIIYFIGGISSGPISFAPISGNTSTGFAPPSSGPLELFLTGKSDTLGVIQPYNDGIINVVETPIDEELPVLAACRNILKQTNRAAAKYKLAVYQNGVLIWTVRSILWGSRKTADENNSDWVVYDAPQFTDVLG